MEQVRKNGSLDTRHGKQDGRASALPVLCGREFMFPDRNITSDMGENEMNYDTYERFMASAVIFILTLGAILIGSGVIVMMMEYGFFQVAVVIMTLLLIARFSWQMAKVVLERGR
jgi:hypothetical protein